MTTDPSLSSTSPQESPLPPAPPRLWNPNAACLWSLPFTPIFGSLVQAKNWRAMGEPSRARASSLWAWGTALYLLVLAVVDIPRFVGLVLLVAWYLSSGSPQIKFVAEKYGTEYEKKSWMPPLSIAFALALAAEIAVLVGETLLD